MIWIAPAELGCEDSPFCCSSRVIIFMAYMVGRDLLCISFHVCFLFGMFCRTTVDMGPMATYIGHVYLYYIYT